MDTPANVLAFEGALQNPSLGGPVVRVTLPDARPATFEVLDVAGRRVLSRAVGALGIGPHRVNLAEGGRWRPGIYLLRLRHPDRTFTSKVCVLQ